jgi:spermidine/putrescine transport system ATP-binding protein
VTDRARIAVDVRGAVKRYDNFTALQDISLEILDNEFFTLLGPSGCGKTTLLRMIAGFEEVTEGAIALFDQELVDLPPHQRPVNTVFQHYALFPHMSIQDNVGFGLEMQGRPQEEVRQRASDMLELVQLSAFAHRKPAQLSGGQQQRVALARALAPSPKVLLLDEPLSALDLKLRKAMQLELKHIQRETGITFIFVTHDQEEALTMSDRVAVMSDGQLQQLGTPRDIYECPRTRFVADFIGETNLLEVSVGKLEEAWLSCTLADGQGVLCDPVAGVTVGTKAHVSIRPERLMLSREPTEPGSLKATVVENIFIGTDISTRLTLETGQQISVRASNSVRGNRRVFDAGTTAFINMERGAARLLLD